MEFPLHAYIKNLERRNASAAFIAAIRRTAKPLVDANLPVILTLGHLCHYTGVSYKVLLGIAWRSIDPYKVFKIRKRNGGGRFICVPEPSLLFVQRWIHKYILCASTSLEHVSKQATAYVPGSGHRCNAERHLGAEWVLKLDITRFFESISERQVYRVFRKLGYRALVAFCLARLCTRVLPPPSDYRVQGKVKRWRTTKKYKIFDAYVVGHLPQGAPTSPMLANMVCFDLDKEIQKVAAREGLTYSRYADDMTLSGGISSRSKVDSIVNEVSKIVGRYGFGVNHQKTAISNSGARQIVTGLSIRESVVKLPRSYKDKIRQELYFIKARSLDEHCAWIKVDNRLSYVLRLSGKIRYAISIEPDAGNKMMAELRAVIPNIDELERLSGL